MDDESALLRAVLLDPKDINARLVLADWWEEYGTEKEQARAHYVRSSIDYPQGSFAALTREESDPFALLGLVPGSAVSVGMPGKKQNMRTWMWGETDEVGLAVHDVGRGLSYCVDDGFVFAVLCRSGDFTEDAAHMLFSLHPITNVMLTDRHPLEDRIWAYFEEPPHRPWHLPRPIWDLLDGCVYDLFISSHKEYAGTRVTPAGQAAREALSRACVSWGRSLVGLPKL